MTEASETGQGFPGWLPARTTVAESALISEVFDHSVFEPSIAALTGEPTAGWRRVYEQARHINDCLPTAEVVRRQRVWHALLAETAMRSPQLLFVLLSHHAVYVGALEHGAGSSGSRFLSELESMSAFGVVCYTETGIGGSLWNIGTHARYQAGRRQFTLRTAGRTRKLMVNAGLPGVPKIALAPAHVVVGTESQGVFSFLVPLRDREGPAPGVSFSDLTVPPVLPLDYVSAAFNDVAVPVEDFAADGARLGESGRIHDPLTSAQRAARLVAPSRPARIGTAVAAAAMSRASAHLAVGYVRSRRASGPGLSARPMAEYRNVALDVVSVVADAYAVTALTDWTTDLIESGAGAPDRMAGLVKAVTVRMAQRISHRCLLLCGARGFLPENHLISYHGFAQAFEQTGGANDMLLVGTGHALRQLDRDQTGPALADMAPDSDPAHPQPWLDMLRAQEERLRRELDDGCAMRADSDLESWNRCFRPAGDLALAHGARLTGQAMVACARTARDSSTRESLLALCAVHLIQEVERRAGWLLSRALLDPELYRRVGAVLDSLAARLLPFVTEMTNGFLVPDDVRVSVPGWEGNS